MVTAINMARIKDGLWYICTYRYVTSHPNRQTAPGLPSLHRPSPPRRTERAQDITSLVRSVSSGVFDILGQAAGATGDDHVVMSRRNLPDERASVRKNPGMNPRDFSSTL